MGYAVSQQVNNADLIWQLTDISAQQTASEFIKQFENKLCVYSPSVKQLYSNYSIFFPDDHQHSMVVLPDPYAFQDTFNRIPSNAVQATGLHLVPGELINRQGLHLVMSNKPAAKLSVPLRFTDGIRQLFKRFSGQDPFLPVLVRGDLREFNSSVPCLHLHRLRRPLIDSFSPLEKQNIKNVITHKIMGMYQDAMEAQTMKNDNKR